MSLKSFVYSYCFKKATPRFGSISPRFSFSSPPKRTVMTKIDKLINPDFIYLTFWIVVRVKTPTTTSVITDWRHDKSTKRQGKILGYKKVSFSQPSSRWARDTRAGSCTHWQLSGKARKVPEASRTFADAPPKRVRVLPANFGRRRSAERSGVFGHLRTKRRSRTFA